MGMSEKPVMIKKKTWEEFRKSGLLWWVNRILHTFGWAICIDYDDKTKEIKEVFPARCKFRGFGREQEEDGYKKVSAYLKDNIDEIEKEANE